MTTRMCYNDPIINYQLPSYKVKHYQIYTDICDINNDTQSAIDQTQNHLNYIENNILKSKIILYNTQSISLSILLYADILVESF